MHQHSESVVSREMSERDERPERPERPERVAYWLLLGGLFHLICIVGIHEMYLRPRIVSGVAESPPMVAPPARRVVVFVLDGLRADRLFEDPPPFLNHIMRTEGRFGLSHAAAPTETLTRHVALFAGFEEGPTDLAGSYVRKTPRFDHVFRRASNAFLVGNNYPFQQFLSIQDPNLTLVARGRKAPDPVEEDLERVEVMVRLLNTRDIEMRKRLSSDRLTLLLHLDTFDEVGHRYPAPMKRPEYTQGLVAIDSAIKRVAEVVRAAFPDGRTAFVVTSDHGTNNRGVHGGAEPSETETPIVLWGAGVAKPSSRMSPDPDARFSAWGLSAFDRMDITQVDACPLLASLLGVPVPRNNTGQLPPRVLATPAFESAARAATAHQLVSNLLRQAELTHGGHRSSAFGGLERAADLKQQLERAVERRLDAPTLDVITAQLGPLARAGLDFYRDRNRLVVGMMLIPGYLAWMWLVFGLLARSGPTRAYSRRTATMTAVVAGATATAAGMALLWSGAPQRYALYAVTTALLACVALTRWAASLDPKSTSDWRPATERPAAGPVLVTVGVLVFIACGYFWRAGFALAPLGIGALPWLCGQRTPVARQWALACFGTATFCLLPANEEIHAWPSVLGVVALLALTLKASADSPWAWRKLRLMQQACLIFSVPLALVSSSLLAQGGSLPAPLRTANASLSVFALLLTLLLTLLHRRGPNCALTRLTLGFAPSLVLLSQRYEILFLSCLLLVLRSWISMEADTLKTGRNSVGRAAKVCDHTGATERHSVRHGRHGELRKF